MVLKVHQKFLLFKLFFTIALRLSNVYLQIFFFAVAVYSLMSDLFLLFQTVLGSASLLFLFNSIRFLLIRLLYSSCPGKLTALLLLARKILFSVRMRVVNCVFIPLRCLRTKCGRTAAKRVRHITTYSLSYIHTFNCFFRSIPNLIRFRSSSSCIVGNLRSMLVYRACSVCICRTRKRGNFGRVQKTAMVFYWWTTTICFSFHRWEVFFWVGYYSAVY